MTTMTPLLTDEVRDAVDRGVPLVALETTLVSHGFSGGRGLTVAVESERRFAIALQPPPDSPLAASVTRYAMVTLCRARHGLEDKLSAGDIAELDALAPALLARHDLTVRTSRTVWLARKPAG